MSAVAILTVGTEILEGQMIDRNSQSLSLSLHDKGIEVGRHVSVGDDRNQILKQLEELGREYAGVIVTGGLGPTSDDFTREVIAQYAHKPLQFIDESFNRLSQLLQSRGVVVKEIQKQQAYFPQGALVFENSQGTADGFGLLVYGKPIIVLPGPPLEIQAIWPRASQWFTSLIPSAQSNKIRKTLTFLGIGESQVAEIAEAANKSYGFELGYRVHRPFVEFKVWGPKNEEIRLNAYVEELSNQLKQWFWFSENGDYLSRLSVEKFEHLIVIDESRDHLFLKRLQGLQSVNEHPQSVVVACRGHLKIDQLFEKSQPGRPVESHLGLIFFDIDDDHAGLKVDILIEGQSFESSEVFEVKDLTLKRLKKDVLAEKAIQFLSRKIQSLTSSSVTA